MNVVVADLLIQILLFSVVTVGLDLIVGYARIFSVSHALLFGIGAFAYSGLFSLFGFDNVLLALVIAIPVAALLSALTAIVSLRVVGDYFIVVSFGLQLIGIQVIYNWTEVSGGSSGMFGLPYPDVFGWSPSSPVEYLVLVGIVVAIVYLIVVWLLLSPYGRLIRSLGQDEVALGAAGFSALSLKVSTFSLSGGMAAAAGVLYAGYTGVAQVNDFSLDLSITFLAMVVIGGGGRLAGGIIGALLMVLIPFALDQIGLPSSSSGPVKQAIFGALLLGIVLFLPSGITGGIADLWRRVTRRGAAVDAVPRGSDPKVGAAHE
ncbi:branched-chain amino acid ABC transporter permease [Microbacterium sp. RD1]|uniref:branched-chain amino acid ABC transporter permease n=1 Tax=Microbacterium sp. RD1 TaxID=3457313 RepID=UPI003FA6086C